MFISSANSIRYIRQDNDLPNRENTLSYDKKVGSWTIKEYCQRFKNDDVVTSQGGSESSTLPTIEVYAPELVGTITPVLVNTLDGTYYFEWEVDFSNYSDKFQIKVTQGDYVFLSEYLKGDDLQEELDNGSVIRFDYTNAAKEVDYINFEIDYTTGIEFFFYVEGALTEQDFQGSKEVITNVNRKVMTEAQLYIQQKLVTEEIPEFMSELIGIALSHFYCLINDLQYVVDGVPEIEQVEKTNMQLLKQTVIQQDPVAFNTNNRGLINTDNVKTLDLRNVTTSETFEVTKEYILHVLYASHEPSSTADFTYDIGTTPGGDDIISGALAGNIPLSGGTNQIPQTLHIQKAVDTTYYVTINGVGAVGRFVINLIKNS